MEQPNIQTPIQARQQTVKHLLSAGIIVNPTLLKKIIDHPDPAQLLINIESAAQGGTLNAETFENIITEKTRPENMSEPQITQTTAQQNTTTTESVHQTPTTHITQTNTNNQKINHLYSPQEGDPEPPVVKVLFSYKAEPKKRTVQDFISYFNSRYQLIKRILQNRKELNSAASINRVIQSQNKEDCAIIGLISDKQETKNGNIMLTLEDPTGTIKVLAHKNNTEAHQTAKESVLDEVIGVVGSLKETTIFAKTILLPDVPITKELRKAPEEAYLVGISCVHVGSKLFLEEEFLKFIKWLRCEHGTPQQREIARKVRYLFIVGDLVEGVGVYPEQDKELTIPDVKLQYAKLAEYLKMLPPTIHVIISPGNHDAMRIAEPQPPLYKDFAEAIYELPNTTIVSNPAIINIHAVKEFPGIDVLLYHGYSFIYYADTIEEIRAAGGQKRADLIMKFLLKRRHLAPAHTSTQYIPDANKDTMVIETVPDIFLGGHLHRSIAANYRNVTTVTCSCWIEATEYQEKLGITPQPGRVPVINLQTRQVKMFRFYDEDTDKKEENTQQTATIQQTPTTQQQTNTTHQQAAAKSQQSAAQ